MGFYLYVSFDTRDLSSSSAMDCLVIKLWAGKGKLKIDFSDIFYTNQGRVTIDLFDQHAGFVNYNDSRKIRLNFTYRFGGTYAPTQRKTSNEEERNRATK